MSVSVLSPLVVFLNLTMSHNAYWKEKTFTPQTEPSWVFILFLVFMLSQANWLLAVALYLAYRHDSAIYLTLNKKNKHLFNSLKLFI